MTADPVRASLHQVLVSRRLGGAALIAMDLARAAERRGWPGVTWVPGPGPALDAVVRDGLTHRVMELKVGSVPRLLACARLFVTMVRERRALVHLHDGWMWGQVRPALLKTGARSIVHSHLDPDDAEIAWTLKRPPTHIVTCARYIASRIRSVVDQRGLRVPVTAVPNSVDLDRFHPGDRQAARRQVGLEDPRPFVMLMLANLSPHKGQATALRTLSRLRQQGLPAECWIVGEDRAAGGDYLGTLRALAAELSVTEHARFLGYRSDAPDLLRAADAFILPTTHEGLPLSLLEAQAVGVPVVASNIPGVLEVVEDGRTGFIVPADDPGGYADRLALLSRDTELRGRLTQAATECVRREHQWATYEDRMFEIYASLAGEERVA